MIYSRPTKTPDIAGIHRNARCTERGCIEKRENNRERASLHSLYVAWYSLNIHSGFLGFYRFFLVRCFVRLHCGFRRLNHGWGYSFFARLFMGVALNHGAVFLFTGCYGAVRIIVFEDRTVRCGVVLNRTMRNGSVENRSKPHAPT